MVVYNYSGADHIIDHEGIFTYLLSNSAHVAFQASFYLYAGVRESCL